MITTRFCCPDYDVIIAPPMAQGTSTIPKIAAKTCGLGLVLLLVLSFLRLSRQRVEPPLRISTPVETHEPQRTAPHPVEAPFVPRVILTNAHSRYPGVIPDFWPYTLYANNGNATLDTAFLAIVFKGVHYFGTRSGSLRVYGNNGAIPDSDYSESSFGGGRHIQFNSYYADGVNTITFAGHTLNLTNMGTRWVIDGQVFVLGDKKQTIIVRPKGPIKVIPSDS